MKLDAQLAGEAMCSGLPGGWWTCSWILSSLRDEVHEPVPLLAVVVAHVVTTDLIPSINMESAVE